MIISIQNIFWIYPKSNIANKNKLIYQKKHIKVTTTTDTFPLNDSYSVAIQSGCYIRYGVVMTAIT